MLEFKVYTSLIEIRFDYENALGLSESIVNISFIFSNKSISVRDVKPIGIEYELEDDVVCHDIDQIYETLGYIPTLYIGTKIGINPTDVKENAKGGYGIAYALQPSFITKLKKGSPRSKMFYDELDNKLEEFFKVKSLEGGSVEYSYKNEQSKFKDYNMGIKVLKEGLVIDNDILLSKDKEYCEQEYNGISKYKYIIYLSENTDLHSLGYFYVYNSKPVYPLKENIAFIKKCAKCGKYYIQDYAKQLIDVCYTCTK